MYFVKTPFYLKTVYPSLIWDIKKKNTLYLSFDDGPIPVVTEEILNMLRAYNASATFFCIGENIRQNKNIFEKLKIDGHAIGNHTYHHLNGWKTDLEKYVEDVKLCDAEYSTPLFRPPYGRIGYQQIQELKKQYKIIMWDVLSGDFDTELDATKCTKNVIENAVDGSIVVFHDSLKAKDRVLKSLPLVLEHFSKEGFVFDKMEF
ncbi:MAG: polysaccharide deacetylase family protein [Bacteroidetes bacterium]|jgi:peptidoglycan/xylan/chitin deacetylase (PgdA/CDA1 family)|nr:polysaccharide deacetylase family protein [Bacteroidota bacterium]MBP9797389.1 polysaccharide deacetylase family protein [Chitinophagales bacterium]